MEIYEILLGRMYEGVLDSFCTTNKKDALNWLNTHYDDYATFITWCNGIKIKTENYVLKKDGWILKSYK